MPQRTKQRDFIAGGLLYPCVFMIVEKENWFQKKQFATVILTVMEEIVLVSCERVKGNWTIGI